MRSPLNLAFISEGNWHDIGKLLKNTQDKMAIQLQFSNRVEAVPSKEKPVALAKTCLYTGISLLSLAAYHGNLEAVKYLLSQNVSHSGFGDLLFWSREHEHIIKFLQGEFEKDSNLLTRFPTVTLAHINAALGDVEFFNSEENKKKLAEPNADGISPGFYAYVGKHEGLMKLIDLKSITDLMTPKSKNSDPLLSGRPFRAYCLYLLGQQDGGLTYSRQAIHQLVIGGEQSCIGKKLRMQLLAACYIQSGLQDSSRRGFSDALGALSILSGDYYFSFVPKDWLDLVLCYKSHNLDDPEEKKQKMSELLKKYKENMRNRDVDKEQTDEDDLRTWSELFFQNGEKTEAFRYLSKIQKPREEDLRLLAHCYPESDTRLGALNKIANKNDEDYRAIYEAQQGKIPVNGKIPANEKIPVKDKISALELIVKKTSEEHFDLAEFYMDVNEYQKAALSYQNAAKEDEANISNSFPVLLRENSSTEERFRRRRFHLLKCYLGEGLAFLRLKKYSEAEVPYTKLIDPSFIGYLHIYDFMNIVKVFLELERAPVALALVPKIKNSLQKDILHPENNIVGEAFMLYLSTWENVQNQKSGQNDKLFQDSLKKFTEFPVAALPLRPEYFNFLFDLGRRLPMDQKTWKPLAKLMYQNKASDFTEIEEYFLEEFHKADDNGKNKIQDICELMYSETKGAFNSIINQDKSCESAGRFTLGSSPCEKFAPINIYANARLYSGNKGKVLNLEQVINCCSEPVLKHYLKLELSGLSKIGGDVFTFLHTITPQISTKTITEKFNKENMPQIFLYTALYLLPAKTKLAELLINKALELCAPEFATILVKMVLSGDYPEKCEALHRLFFFSAPKIFFEAFSAQIQNELSSKETELFCKTLSFMHEEKEDQYLKSEDGQKFFITMMSALGEEKLRASICSNTLEIILGERIAQHELFLKALNEHIKSSAPKSPGFKELCKATVEKMLSKDFEYKKDHCDFWSPVYIFVASEFPVEEFSLRKSESLVLSAENSAQTLKLYSDAPSFINTSGHPKPSAPDPSPKTSPRELQRSGSNEAKQIAALIAERDQLKQDLAKSQGEVEELKKAREQEREAAKQLLSSTSLRLFGRVKTSQKKAGKKEEPELKGHARRSSSLN